MSLVYKNQNMLEKLAAKTGQSLTLNRRGDMQGTLYGGRGNDYDELQYLRHQNTDAQGVNNYHSDAWNKFATGRGVVGSRVDQEEREFFSDKTFP